MAQSKAQREQEYEKLKRETAGAIRRGSKDEINSLRGRMSAFYAEEPYYTSIPPIVKQYHEALAALATLCRAPSSLGG